MESVAAAKRDMRRRSSRPGTGRRSARPSPGKPRRSLGVLQRSASSIAGHFGHQSRPPCGRRGTPGSRERRRRPLRTAPAIPSSLRRCAPMNRPCGSACFPRLARCASPISAAPISSVRQRSGCRRQEPSTIQVTLLPLQAIFRRVIALGEIAVNPCTGLELPAVRGRRERYASSAEAARLLEAFPSADRAILATAYVCGTAPWRATRSEG